MCTNMFVSIGKSNLCKIYVSPKTSILNRVIVSQIILITFPYFYSSQPQHLTHCTETYNKRKCPPQQIYIRNNEFSAVVVFDLIVLA